MNVEPSVPNRFPWPKHVVNKVEGLVRKVSTPVVILAIDEFRLLRIENQFAGRKAILQRTPQRPRLFGALAVTNGIVRVSLERDVRIVLRHPHVERVVQEQVCQQRANDSALWRARLPRHDAAVLHLHRRLQPALDIEQ